MFLLGYLSHTYSDVLNISLQKMKTVTLTLAATTVASTSVPRALLNLRNHTLLNTSMEMSPLETIAHLATFEDVPVFGGFELRE